MQTKAEAARSTIVQAARSLFARKGYSAVNMQEVCREAKLSRGGVYRYYSSTEELFSVILCQEQARAVSALQRAKADRIPAKQMLDVFLKSRLRQLQNTQTGIENAISEFAANSEQGRRLLQERASLSIRILKEMIQLGNEEKSFSCDEPESAAVMILCLLEGLGKHAGILPLSEQQLEKQLELIYNVLGAGA